MMTFYLVEVPGDPVDTDPEVLAVLARERLNHRGITVTEVQHAGTEWGEETDFGQRRLTIRFELTRWT